MSAHCGSAPMTWAEYKAADAARYEANVKRVLAGEQVPGYCYGCVAARHFRELQQRRKRRERT